LETRKPSDLLRLAFRAQPRSGVYGVGSKRIGVIMRQHYPALTLVVAVAFLTGCKQGADKFFSGRPSEMSMVHNRIIGGPPEAMVELLRVPSRYPDATESHIADWQESVIAWWGHAEKHQLMTASFGKTSPGERQALRNWLRVRDKHRSQEKAKALDEIEAALDTAALSPQGPP
jgi:hypothetical protein